MLDQKLPAAKKYEEDVFSSTFSDAKKLFKTKPFGSGGYTGGAGAHVDQGFGGGSSAYADRGFSSGSRAHAGTNRENVFDLPKKAESKNFGAVSTTLDYGVGDTVRHMKFGTGVVTDIIKGGRDYEVTVEFSSAGVKKMFANFAKLQKVD